ncbi:MAG: haloalkane dehalogenase [Gammaproteobacteria bacterium]|nr:haloalkane dehalogenase [Gammaproteobacteria bacterium]|tara:strand:- start:5243 stop:6250 length:1008 start_codon:yes stop_codon:yes gene_type:complete
MLAAADAVADEIAPGIYRTPDTRFANLPDYAFQPHYVMVDGLRMHYVDEGPRDGQVVLLLHGEPSWSYLYRHMIPVLAQAGYRVVAPDLIGFGRSDKPADTAAHTHSGHVAQISVLLGTLDLQHITLFIQDWGGLIGLRVLADMPERFAGVVAANTGLPAADGIPGIIGYPMFRLSLWWQGEVSWDELQAEPGFLRWAAYSRSVDDMPVGQVVAVDISAGDPAREAIIRAYDAPFPSADYKAGPAIMPSLVPSELALNAEAWQVLEQWQKPFLTAFSDGDPITAGGDIEFQQRIPGAAGQNHTIIEGAGHFLQETHGEQLARLMLAFMSQPGYRR